jgi:hypothetical protein
MPSTATILAVACSFASSSLKQQEADRERKNPLVFQVSSVQVYVIVLSLHMIILRFR